MSAGQPLEQVPTDGSQAAEDATHGVQSHEAAPPDGGRTPSGQPRARRGKNLRPTLSYVALALAAAWMVVAIVMGILIVQPPDVSRARATSPETLSPTSFPMTYGGDAYTGIQNAASATENSVVASGNMVAETTAKATKSQTSDLQKLALAVGRPLQVGAATLTVGSGVGPFVIVLAVVARTGPRRGRQAPSQAFSSAAENETGLESEEK